ncbi:MAG: zinc ABC transporter substrate-binding protein [Deltaproteobacteria bacterium]|nr:zinc ABC transporter substrate-binding protein [Deltaproteobacteria bacterium]
MIGKISFKLLLFLATVIICAKVSVAAEAPDNQIKLPITVFVSIGAHLDFCQEIGAERVLVKLALPPGKSPATYAPTPHLVQDLSQSSLYFKVGLPFETALLRKIIALPRSPEIIDTQKDIILQPMQSGVHKKNHDRHNYRHPGKSHSHAGLDPHTWLDPQLALKHATTIYRTLSQVDPDGKNIYTNNYNLLKDKLKVLDKDLKKSFKPFIGSTIFVYHPAFGYFARAFELRQIAIEFAGKKPTAKELENFITEARRENISALFVQPQFDRRSANKISQILGCKVIGIDPLATDYCRNLSHIATAILANIKD